eukprot:5120541-Lingulodinium_polyedra.AAC.1
MRAWRGHLAQRAPEPSRSPASAALVWRSRAWWRALQRVAGGRSPSSSLCPEHWGRSCQNWRRGPEAI